MLLNVVTVMMVLCICGTHGDNMALHIDNGSLQAHSHGQDELSKQDSTTKQGHHQVSEISQRLTSHPSQVLPVVAVPGDRAQDRHHPSSPSVATSSLVSTSLQTSHFLEDSPQNSQHQYISPSKRVFNSLSRKDTIAEKDSTIKFKLSSEKINYHHVPQRKLKPIRFVSRSSRSFYNFQPEIETNSSIVLLNSGKTSQRMHDSKLFDSTQSGGKITTTELPVNKELKNSNKYNNNNLGIFSVRDYQIRQLHKNIPRNSYQARATRGRSPQGERYRRELLTRNRFPPILWQFTDTSIPHSVADDNSVDKNRISGNRNSDFPNENRRIIEKPQREVGEDIQIVKDMIDSSLYPELHVNKLVNSNMESSSAHRVPETFQFDVRGFNTFSRNRLSEVNRNLNRIPILYLTSNEDANVQQRPHFIKRYFDSIGSGFGSGLSQNHVDKRDWEYTDNEDLPVMFENGEIKRNFDAIDGGPLSGLEQNYVSKRYFLNLQRILSKDVRERNQDREQLGQFQRSSGNLETNQHNEENELNRMQPKLFQSSLGNLETSQQIQDNGGLDLDLNEADNYMFKRMVDDGLQADPGYKTHQMLTGDKIDLISDLARNRNRNRQATKNFLYFLAKIPTENVVQNYMEKRLDTISNGALGGIRQNFFDKKLFDSFSKELSTELSKKFLLKTYFSSFGRGLLEGNRHSFLLKRNLGSTSGNISLVPSNTFQDETTFPNNVFNSIDENGDKFYEKRNFDPSSLNLMGQFSPNIIKGRQFSSKRSFDMISGNLMSGLNQNFLGRGNNFVSGNRMNYLYPNYFKKRNQFDENIYLDLMEKRNQLDDKMYTNAPRNLDLVSQTSFENDGLRHFENDENGARPHLKNDENLEVSEDRDNDEQDDLMKEAEQGSMKVYLVPGY